MSKQRSETAAYRNIRLRIETYEKLDQYLFELMKDKNNKRLALDDAVKTLLDEHYSTKKKE